MLESTEEKRNPWLVKTCTKFRPLNFLCTRFVLLLCECLLAFSFSFFPSLSLYSISPWAYSRRNRRRSWREEEKIWLQFSSIVVCSLCSHSLKIYSMVCFFPFQPNYEHNYLHMKTNGMHVVAVAEQRKKWINSASAGVWCDLGSCTVRNPLEAKTPEKCQINRLFGKLSPSRKSSAKFAISVYFSNHFICACHLNRLAFFYREFVQ